MDMLTKYNKSWWKPCGNRIPYYGNVYKWGLFLPLKIQWGKHMKRLLMTILLASFCLAADNPDFTFDSSGNRHAVYEDAGNIYYMLNDNSAEIIATGTSPAIALDTEDHPHVAYDSGNIYYIAFDVTWSSPLSIGAGDKPDIAVDSEDYAHIVYQTGGYNDIIQAVGPSFVPTVEKDGYWYPYGGADNEYSWFTEPNIKIQNDVVYIMYKNKHTYRWMGGSDTSYNLGVKSSAGAEMTTRNSREFSLGKNPLTIVEGSPLMIYSKNSIAYLATTNFTAWSESSLGGVSQGSIDSSGADYALTYVSSGDVVYRHSDNIADELTIEAGSKPVIGLGSLCVYYVNATSGIESNCASPATTEIDADADGSPEGEDCDDSDSSTYPGATELCDGLDNDCDGSIPATEQDADGDGVSVCEGDCNDNNPDSQDAYWVFVDRDHDGYHDFTPDTLNQDPSSAHYEMLYACVSSMEAFSLTSSGRDYCDDDETAYLEEDCSSDEPIGDVPEFGLLGGLLAISAVGLYIVRRR